MRTPIAIRASKGACNGVEVGGCVVLVGVVEESVRSVVELLRRSPAEKPVLVLLDWVDWIWEAE